MENKLDLFINELSQYSTSPIKNAYNMTVDAYLSEDKQELVKEDIYNQLLYYYLTDLMDGCEVTLLMHEFEQELELIKDIISFCKSNSVIMELIQKVQFMRVKISKLNISENTKQHFDRFILMAFSLHDKKYIKEFVHHLVKIEEKEPDELLRFINQRVMQEETKILKL